MTSRAEAPALGRSWRLWACVPLVLLTAAVALFTAAGGSVTGLLGETPPSLDEFDIRRVEFHPGEIRIRVTNPQRDELTIASVTVDDAVVPFDVDGDRTLGRLRTGEIVVQYDWVRDEPISVGVTSSTGIETTKELTAAVRTPEASARSFFGYALIGTLVGIVPVALGLLWLPSLRRAAPEGLELQAALPSALGGAGLVLLGVALSFLFLTAISRGLGEGGGGGSSLGGVALATLVAIGIGLHNLGEGLAIGSSFALGELALGTFFVVGFMIHNVTEGLGIASPLAEGREVAWPRLAVLALVAGAPAILGAWVGGFVTSDLLGVVFFAAAAGAAFEVVVEVGRYVARKAPRGMTAPHVLGGFLAGVVVMYVTCLLVA